MSVFRGPGRRRSILRFLLATAYFIVARFLADKAAHGFSFGEAFPLIRNLFLLFLEIVGFGYMGLAFDDTRQPLRVMGMARRPGWQREFALGAAIGWGMVTCIVLVLALSGALYVHIQWTTHLFFLLAVQLGVLAVGALADEVAFRGYPFQKLIEAFGPFAATGLACIFFGLLRMESPDAGTAGIWVSGIAAVLLSVAYLRTRALWLSWGLHFAWLASMGILFGLPLGSNTDAATIVQTDTYGRLWMTGGDYGPEAGWLAAFILIAGLFVLVRVTRDLSWTYNQPVLIPAGIPMDVPHPTPVSPATSKPEPPQAPQFVSLASLTQQKPSVEPTVLPAISEPPQSDPAD